MLGYVAANREKLSPEDLETYRAYYCGLCLIGVVYIGVRMINSAEFPVCLFDFFI